MMARRSIEDEKTDRDGHRQLARARAAHILSRKFTSRESVKAKMLENQEAVRARMRAERESTRRRWKLKTRHSPFLVDLVAENERLEEENKVRLAAEAHHLRLFSRQRIALKQHVITRALREDSDLDALRREKRAIVDEERRLKALLDLEKNHLKDKIDMQAAVRAERQRALVRTQIRRHDNVYRLRKQHSINHELLCKVTGFPSDTRYSF